MSSLVAAVHGQSRDVAHTGGVAVELRGLRHVYRSGIEALRSVDTTIGAGSFVALLGPSGCGKSTLLRLIAGLEEPTAGRIELSPAADVPFEREHDVGFVFQDAQLLPWRSVWRNIMLPMELAPDPAGDAWERASQALAAVGLDGFEKKLPNELSGGMRMRVSIARAIVTRPKLLLMDEPFAALDEITRQRLDELLRQLWSERGMTVLFVTHSTAEAAYLSTRTIVLSPRPGRIVLDEPVELPADRPAELRGSAEFAAQTRRLFDALRQEGTPSSSRSNPSPDAV